MRKENGYDAMSADWQKELMDGLKAYTDDVTKGVKESVEAVGKEATDQLKKTSPKKIKGKKTGKYAKGWRVQKTKETATECEATIFNKTDYQLTHLLENGHINRDGSFTDPRPHIGTVREMAAKNLEGKIIQTIEG